MAEGPLLAGRLKGEGGGPSQHYCSQRWENKGISLPSPTGMYPKPPPPPFFVMWCRAWGIACARPRLRARPRDAGGIHPSRRARGGGNGGGCRPVHCWQVGLRPRGARRGSPPFLHARRERGAPLRRCRRPRREGDPGPRCCRHRHAAGTRSGCLRLPCASERPGVPRLISALPRPAASCLTGT